MMTASPSSIELSVCDFVDLPTLPDHCAPVETDNEGLPVVGVTQALPANQSPQEAGGGPESAPVFPLGQTFQLHSNPGASKVIYLDFDGHTTTGTYWNNSWSNIITPAFSFQGDSSFSNAELERIQNIWRRVAEDFLPFDVNVTTEDPGLEALRNSGGGDQHYGVRVAIGGSSYDWYGHGAGGVAYLTSFDWSTDTPAFVFSDQLGNGNEHYTAEAVSHEVGHALGLSHDGTSSSGYYQGHGSGATGWAPILGVGYYRQLTQFSNGTYPDADNQQDDLHIITTGNGFGYRSDDHGNAINSASSIQMTSLTDISDSGIIERNTDLDYFSFTTGDGNVTLNINPADLAPNLDILARVYREDGSLVATSNPTSALNASFNLNLTAGTYYLSIDGTGKAAGADPGYSDYGSLGYFSVTGTLVAPAQEAHWTYDETSGSIAADSMGGDNDGTIMGGTFVNDAVRGRVLALDGTDYMRMDSASVDLGAEWTIASWFKDLGNGTWRTLTRGQSQDHQIIVSADGSLGTYNSSTNTFYNSGCNLSSLSSDWHHVTAVGSGGTTTFYVDGVEVGSVSYQSSSDVYTVGNTSGGSQRFADMLDDTRIYDRALSAGEIATLADPGPVAPVAQDDQFDVVFNQAFTSDSTGVLHNDTDMNQDTLTVSLVSGPSNASAFQLNSDGSFTYTPQTDFRGTDTFQYRASDGGLQSEIATVTLVVEEPGLVGLWEFEETSGETAVDSAGGDQNGTLTGGATFVNDATRGRVLSLSGSQHVRLNDGVVDLGGEWTISSWFQGLSQGGWKTLTRGQSRDHQIIVSSGGALGTFDNTANVFRSTGFNMNSLDNGWHHIAAVGSGARTTFYVDGTEVGWVGFKSTSDVFSLGNTAGGTQRFSDQLDDTRVYSRALNSSEIQSLADPGPTAPVAADDSFQVAMNQAFSSDATGVLHNDTDVNQDNLTVNLVSGPSHHAAFQLNSDGSFTYTPQTDFRGTDTFQYRASDGGLQSEIATVTLVVEEPGLVALWEFEETSGSTAADTAGGDQTGTVIGGGTFVNDATRGRVLSLSGNQHVRLNDGVADLGSEWTIASWFQGMSQSGWKTLTRGQSRDHQIIVSSSGLLGTYDNTANVFRSTGFNVNSLDSGWHHIAAVGSGTRTTFFVDGTEVGWVGFKSTSDVFSLGNTAGGTQRFADQLDDTRIYDRALSGSEIQTLADPGPTAPVAQDDSFQVAMNQAYTSNATGVLHNDTDINQDNLTVSLVSGPSNSSAFQLNSDGSFTYTPQNDFRGTDSFQYRASDGGLQSEVATVTLVVEEPGLVGLWEFDETTGSTAADTAGGDQDGTLIGGGTFVNDATRGQVLSLSGSQHVRLNDGVVDLGAEWTIASWFQGLKEGGWKTLTRGQSRDHQIIVSSSGSLGTYDNSANVFRSTGFNMNSLDSGWHHIAAVGSGTRTTFFVDGQEVGWVGFKSTSDVFSLGNTAGGTQRFADQLDETRIYDRVLSDSEIQTLADPGPTAPVAQDDSFQVTPNQPYTSDSTGVLHNDTDINQDSLTVTLVSGPSNSSAFQLNSDGSFTYTPQNGFRGTDTFQYRASDGGLQSEIATVTLVVEEPGLVGLWEFNESSGSTASDSAGGDHDGTLVGGSFVNDGTRGQVLSLSGNDHVRLNESVVDLGSQWTITSWFQGLGQGSWKTLTRGQTHDHQIIVSSSGLLGTYDNTANVFRSSGFNMNSLDNGWHHIAAIGSGNTTTYYVDGTQVGWVGYKSTSDVYTLGNTAGGTQRFADRLDDARIYDRALSGSEVATLAGQGSGAVPQHAESIVTRSQPAMHFVPRVAERLRSESGGLEYNAHRFIEDIRSVFSNESDEFADSSFDDRLEAFRVLDELLDLEALVDSMPTNGSELRDFDADQLTDLLDDALDALDEALIDGVAFGV